MGTDSDLTMDNAVEDGLRVREAELRAQINQQLEESGEKSALKELLKSELLQSGWRDELKTHCAEVIRTKGLDDISLEMLVEEITPHARETVPDNVKNKLLRRIRKFLSDHKVQAK